MGKPVCNFIDVASTGLDSYTIHIRTVLVEDGVYNVETLMGFNMYEKFWDSELAPIIMGLGEVSSEGFVMTVSKIDTNDLITIMSHISDLKRKRWTDQGWIWPGSDPDYPHSKAHNSKANNGKAQGGKVPNSKAQGGKANSSKAQSGETPNSEGNDSQ